MKNEIIQKVISLVMSSERPMPAHYTTGKNGRTQSFCIDFEPLYEEDEYDMASVAWYSASDHGIEFPDKHDCGLTVKFGEDIMIGAYILEILGGRTHLDDLMAALIAENIENFIANVPNIKEIVERVGVSFYFNYCKMFGADVANSMMSKKIKK